MKKLTVFRIKKKVYRGLEKAAVLILLLGMAGPCVMQVSANENPGGEVSESLEADMSVNQTVTYIYHRHAGSEQEEGGCYHTPVYHSHTGSEGEGGGCYGNPVLHVHTGNESSGGGCYGTPVLHVHAGNSGQEGGCFAAVRHVHGGGCYREVTSGEYGCYTVSTSDTGDGDYAGHDFKYYYMSCGETVYGTNSSHHHVMLVCDREGAVEGFTTVCGRTETSAERYVFDCEKTEGETVDSYALSCEKNVSDIEGYGLSCGREDGAPVGRLILTETGERGREQTSLSVSFEDISDGALELSDTPFTWYSPAGNVLGTGESVIVSENGNYSVVLGVVNEDVNRDSLRAEIGVSSIVRQVQDNNGPDGGGSGGNGEDNGGSHEDNGDGGHEENEMDSVQEENSSDQEDNVSEAVPSPLAAPLAGQTVHEQDDADLGGGAGDEKSGRSAERKIEEKGAVKEEETLKLPVPSPKLKKQTESIKLPEKKSQGKEITKLEVKEEKESFFSSPAVRMITITSGALLALCGLFILLYFLRMSVKIYNDDGSGKMLYLGRCRVELSEEGYKIEISDAMEEKAVTNRYCIRPGLFRFFREDGEELLVCRLQKRISVYLNKEMIVVI